MLMLEVQVQRSRKSDAKQTLAASLSVRASAPRRTACALAARAHASHLSPRAQEVPTTSEGEEGKEVEGATRGATNQKEEELRAAKV